MKCKLVDVFAKEKLSGNGLTIFYEIDDLATKQMQSLTPEMRQFESIFLSIENGKFYARIFTVEEELDFAGHTLIGLAAHLHEEYGVNSSHDWNVELNNQTVALKTRKSGDYFEAIMEQGKPEFIKVLNENESEATFPFVVSVPTPRGKALLASPRRLYSSSHARASAARVSKFSEISFSSN